MKVINIIPEDYVGDPKKALGYAWTHLVMIGHKVDFEKSIPGEDIVGDGDAYRKVKNDLEIEFGHTIVIDPKDYNSKDLEIAGDKIAMINCMWCGGASVYVYKKKILKSEDQLKDVKVKMERPDPTVNIKGDEKEYDRLFNDGGDGYNPYRD